MRIAPLLVIAALTLPIVACNNDGKSDADSNIAESGEAGCTPGEINCECSNAQCLGDLQCVAGMCTSGCMPGELGCACKGGQCLGGLECEADLCRDPNCTPGELACECSNGLCLGELQCVGNVCIEGSGDGDGDSMGDGDGAPGDGDGTPGDGDPGCEPGLMDCADGCVDPMTDDDNCGGCGITCKITDDIGHCVAGQCGNAWSDCRNANTDFAPCSQVCQDEGLTCAAAGCKNNTYLWYTALIDCEGVDGNSGNSDLGCNYPMTASKNYYRCCCAQ